MSDSRFSFGSGEFCRTLGDGVGVAVAVAPIGDFEVAFDKWCVANGMEEDVELRLVLVLSDELSLRILCAESARFRLFGDLLYNRLPVLRHSDDLLDEFEVA